MLSANEFLSWLQRLDISEQARTIISHTRSSAPSRRVGGGQSNVSGRYPSGKMGVTIQFESHRVELAGIYEMEHDATVLEYFDQPPPIKLDYESPVGKRMGAFHTPDFFVIRETEAGWEEWKTEKDLRRLSDRNPNRYCTGHGGHWRCPPGAAHAERLGLYYRVRSSAEIDWFFQRNIQFLEDYLRADSKEIAPASREIAVAYVSAMPGLPHEDLLKLASDSMAPDDIFAMIAADDLYVDLRAAPLAEPSRVQVYATREAASRTSRHSDRRQPHLFAATLHCGRRLTWDGRIWDIVNLGETSISLLSEDRKLAELPIAAFEILLRENRLRMDCDDPHLDSAVHDRLSGASQADLRTATSRSGLIGRYLDTGKPPTATDVPTRTLFRWLAGYRRAEATCGSGFLGLLPESGKRGNHTAKLPELSRHLMQQHIDRDYETLRMCCK